MKTTGWLFTAAAAMLLAAAPALAADANTERDYEIALTKGQYEIELGNYAAAIGHLQRALELVPNDQEARVSLGVAYARSGDHQKAKAVLEQAVAADGRDARARYELGLVLESLGRADEAKQMMRSAAETSRDELLADAARAHLGDRAPDAAGPSLRLTGGIQYDDNVILEQDNPIAPTGDKKADWRGVILLEGILPFLVTDRRGGEAAYHFYQSLHGSLEDFNVQQHVGRIGGHYAFSRTARFDLSYEFRYAFVGGEHYSTNHWFAPVLALNLTSRSLTELHGTYATDRYFNTDIYTALSEKNGPSASAGASHTVMFGKKTGFAFDYTYDTHDAVMDYWDYTGHRGAASALTELGHYKLFATLSYHDKKYDGVPPGATVKRHDGVQELSAGVSRKAGTITTITLSDQYTLNDSNIPLYEYRRNIVGLFVEVAL